MSASKEETSFLYQNLQPSSIDCLDDIKQDLQLCEKCFTAGKLVGTQVQDNEGGSENKCAVFQCTKCSTRWACCINCAMVPNIKRAGRFLNRAQWAKHVKNVKSVHQTSKGTKRSRSLSCSPIFNSHIPEDTDDCSIVAAVVDEIDTNSFPTQEDPINSSTQDDTIKNKQADAEKLNTLAAKLFGQPHHLLQSAIAHWRNIDVRGENLGFPNGSRSARYFQQTAITSSETSGMDYLVKQSMMSNRLDATSYQNTSFVLPEGHAHIQMRIAQLAFGMTPHEKDLLVLVMAGCEMIGVENGYSHATGIIDKFFKIWTNDNKKQNDFKEDFIMGLAANGKGAGCTKNAFDWSTRIPNKVNDLRRFYLEGAHSIVKNLPYPEIKDDVPGHSYVSVIDCIRDFLAYHDHRMATISDSLINSSSSGVCHPSQSKRAKEILQQLNNPDALKGYVFFWSDDMEPNRLSKAGRGSVWIATVTIGTQYGDAHNFDNTYALAIGSKGLNHDPIIQKIEEDMKRLRSGELDDFYLGSVRKRAKVLLSDMAYLADQPERRGINYLRLGGRGFTARFGVSANHQECYEEIRACPRCKQETWRRLQTNEFMDPLPTCERCMNWDVLKPNCLLGLANPPEQYPLLTMDNEGPTCYQQSQYCRLIRIGDGQKVRPFRITYESLTAAVKLAHKCYCEHGWSAKNVSAYLKVEGLNDEFISRVMDHATRSYALMIATVETTDDCPTYYTRIRREAEEYPERYGPVPIPPTWTRDRFGIHLNPDVIMHMVFLGVVDDTMQLTQSWLKATKRNSRFIKQNASRLKPLVDMDLQWINVLTYTGEAFGHWVSENFLGFARVMPWFYQNIGDVHPEHIVLPPEKQQKGWTKKHNEHWLKLRGLDTSGRADELRKRVEDYMALDDVPPVKELPQHTVHEVENLVIALQILLECVMATKVTPALLARTQHAVRAFLSAYDSLNESIKGAPTSIFSIFNLACLMNLPEAMETYGPLRQLWEGEIRGEGFLRFAKPLMTQGFKHSNWHYHLLQKLGIMKAFRNILPQRKTETVPTNAQGVLIPRRGFFKKYNSVFEFKKCFEADEKKHKQPISVILTSKVNGDVQLWAVVDTYDTAIEITIAEHTQPTTKFGLHYYEFAYDEALIDWSECADEAAIIGYGLLLPLMEPDQTGRYDLALYKRFALISSNWKKLSPTTDLSTLVEEGSASFD